MMSNRKSDLAFFITFFPYHHHRRRTATYALILRERNIKRRPISRDGRHKLPKNYLRRSLTSQQKPQFRTPETAPNLKIPPAKSLFLHILQLSTLLSIFWRKSGGGGGGCKTLPDLISERNKLPTAIIAQRSNHNVILIQQTFRQTLRTTKDQRRSMPIARSPRQEVLPLSRDHGPAADQHRQRRHHPFRSHLPPSTRRCRLHPVGHLRRLRDDAAPPHRAERGLRPVLCHAGRFHEYGLPEC